MDTWIIVIIICFCLLIIGKMLRDLLRKREYIDDVYFFDYLDDKEILEQEEEIWRREQTELDAINAHYHELEESDSSLFNEEELEIDYSEIDDEPDYEFEMF